mgnify:CR=1 FL=1
MVKDKSFRVPVTGSEKKDIENISFKFGYRSVAAFMRDKSLGLLESDEIKTLKSKNANLSKLLKNQEG